MDNNIKTYTPCYQVLFNKPLRMTKDKYIYGFRMKVSEHFSEKRLLRYIVEAIFGKCLFKMIHDGNFEGENDKIWIDKEGNEYNGYGVQTRLYSYDATVENMMNYRCDSVYVEEGEDYWITDLQDYFDWKAKMDADDHKQGKNQWLENYLRIKSRREVLSYITVKSSENLDYDIQEFIKAEWSDAKIGCPKLVRDEGVSVEKEDGLDELPF